MSQGKLSREIERPGPLLIAESKLGDPSTRESLPHPRPFQAIAVISILFDTNC